MAGITTGLEGAGGFGKTMLVEMACADERVREYFEGRVYIVTIGRDVRGPAAITAKVVEAITFITGHPAPYTDPGMAGDELGRLLDQHPGRRTLLVLDDVWESAQLDPFLRGGKDCVRLVTTRVPVALPDGTTRVRVDQMTQGQARAVLGQDLPPLPEHLVGDLITVMGRWPLLLRLANRWMRHQVETGEGIATAAADILTLLREEGPAAVDRSHQPPDPADPAQRRRLVRATLQAAIGLLPSDEQQRLAELGIFAEDEPIPIPVAARLWKATGGLSRPRSRDLCYELRNLSLLTIDSDGGGFLVLHDVVRDFLRHQLGGDRITALNAALTDAVEASLPPASPLTPSAPCPQVAWWALAEAPGSTLADRYLAAHVIAHLLAGDRADEAEAVACDLRWVEARLHQHGPTAPWNDCSRIPTATAARRARDLAQIAHLLAPTVPSHALTAVLHSRLAPLPGWGDQVSSRRPQMTHPVLRNRWLPPDLPHPALARVLTCRHQVTAVAIAPDGTWLAIAGRNDETVRIWDAAAGAQTAALAGHAGGVTAVAIAPDGTWLATASRKDNTVRIWDAATATHTATLTGHAGPVDTVAIAPDGTWLATASTWLATAGEKDETVRIWDAATATQTATLAGHTGGVTSVAIAPDGTWLATAGWKDNTVRIWDAPTGAQTAALTGHASSVTTVAIAPDGTWLAAGDKHGTARIWNPATGTPVATLLLLPRPAAMAQPGYWPTITIAPDGTWLAADDNDLLAGAVGLWDSATGAQNASLTGQAGVPVTALAIAPDGTWLATGNDRGKVRIWSTASRTEKAALAGHAGKVTAMAIAPDGTWLATAGERDEMVRIWDTASSTQPAADSGHSSRVTAVAIAPDGTWLAATDGGEVHIRDTTTSRQIRVITGHVAEVTALAIAPDGTWLATADNNNAGKVRVWDIASGSQTHVITVHRGGVTAVAIAPDGTWLATAGGQLDGAGGGNVTVRIWDSATGTRTATLTPSTSSADWAAALAIAPDGTWLATAGETDGTVRIWNPLTGAQTATLTPSTSSAGRVTSLAIASDGTWLATASETGGTVRIWDTATGTQTSALTTDAGQVSAVAIAPDGAWLATLLSTSREREGTIQIWDSASEEVVAMMRMERNPLACAWMPDGTGLAVGGQEGLYLYEFHPGTHERNSRPTRPE